EEEELLLHLPAPLFPPFWLRGHRPSTGSVAGPAAMGASGAKEAPAALATPIVQPKNLRAKPASWRWGLQPCGGVEAAIDALHSSAIFARSRAMGPSHGSIRHEKPQRVFLLPGVMSVRCVAMLFAILDLRISLFINACVAAFRRF
ncbi:unnamed protein product, partial [Prorocentrum cordatum]